MAIRRPRWVIKAGSQMVVGGGPILIRDWMKQVAELRSVHGIDVIWVTSGAIASAVDRTRFSPPKNRARTLAEKQALSAIGQPMVMDLYNLSLAAFGELGAQILLTYDDLAHADRRAHFQSTLDQLLRWRVTPVLNENDAVASEEIRFGDNDSLSAKVAVACGAEKLIVLTDVDGLYEADPRKNPKARVVARLEKVTAEWLTRVQPGAGSARGTGGMLSKLQAAQAASEAGITTHLARGDFPRVLSRIAAGESLGTQILGRSGSRRSSGRRAK
jgi:glutamate 5-kinase